MNAFVGFITIAVIIALGVYVLKRVIGLFRGNKPVEVADDVAHASRVAAFISMIAVYFLAPTGFLALGAAIGIVPVPLVVSLAPYIAGFAIAAAAISSAIKLFAKHKDQKSQVK